MPSLRMLARECGWLRWPCTLLAVVFLAWAVASTHKVVNYHGDSIHWQVYDGGVTISEYPRARSSYNYGLSVVDRDLYSTYGRWIEFDFRRIPPMWGSSRGYFARFPVWFVSAAFAMIAGLALIVHRRWGPRAGECIRCQYQLHGAAVCAECGLAAAK